MSTIVSTGQITIIDQNDSKPITAIVTADGSIQQAYSKDNGVELWTPNWASSNITLTANVFVGGIDVTADTSVVTGKKWSTTFDGTSIGSNRTFVRSTNFASTDVSQTYYFTCTYTDPTTKVASRVDCSITLSLVKTGTNAVYVETYGTDVIRDSNTSTKNVGVIKASLVRSSGYDSDNLQYKWYTVSTAGVTTQIYNASADVANFGVMSTAAAAAPSASASNLGASTFTNAGITSNTAWSTGGNPGYNTLVISQEAVTGQQLFKVEVQDTTETGTVYVGYFIVYDVSDPYSITMTSSNGDRFKDGLGQSTLTANVYSGSVKITDYTGWSFDWYIRDQNGARTAFVASSSPPTPDITKSITTNSTSTVTIGSAATLAAGDMVKLVSASGGLVKVAQVSTSTGTTVTLVSATGDNALCNPVSSLTAAEFAGGTLYKAVSKKTVSAANTLTVTQYDIDVKATFAVDANRP